MARLLAITAFWRHASAVTQNHGTVQKSEITVFAWHASAVDENHGSRGTFIINNGICTARFRPTPSRDVESVGDERELAGEPGMAAPVAGLAASEPRLPAPAVEPSATDAEPAGRRRCNNVSHSIHGHAITSSAFGITHAGMPDALLVDVECARVMWFSFDGVALRSRERKGKNIYSSTTYLVGIYQFYKKF